MSSTKLIVLKSKELIYTAILLALVIVFVIILITMFRGKDSDDTSGSARSISTSAQTDPSPKTDETHYTPGTYSASLHIFRGRYNTFRRQHIHYQTYHRFHTKRPEGCRDQLAVTVLSAKTKGHMTVYILYYIRSYVLYLSHRLYGRYCFATMLSLSLKMLPPGTYPLTLDTG